MTTRVLITGASGNIGRPLVDFLAQSHPEVEVFAGSTRGEKIGSAQAVALNLLDEASTVQAFANKDQIVLVTPAHPEMATMTANAVKAAVAQGVKHIIRISGAGADPQSEVAIAKLQGQCDQLIIDSGIAYTLLRPKNFMQNFTTFMRDMVRAGQVYSSHGDGAIPFVDVRDIAEVAMQVIVNPQKYVNQALVMTGPEALSNAEALKSIEQAIGRPVQLVSITEEQAVEAMRQMGMPEFMVQVMSSLNQVIAAGWVSEVSNDIPQVLGKPARSFADFAQEHRSVWL